jgi:hypothetical protein
VSDISYRPFTSKPRLTILPTKSSWFGAMDFKIVIGKRICYLSVDSCDKLDWYIAKLKKDPNFPCGIDYG